MSKTDSKDNSEYWINRHEKHRSKLVSVGHIGKSEDENLTLYADKKKIIFEILRDLNLSNLSGKTVLDGGCGIGLISELFYVLGGKVHGIDASDVAIDQAQYRCPTGKFMSGSLVDFSIDQQFDLIVVADVLYHIVDDKNWQQAVLNLLNHTLPGGTMILIDQVRAEIAEPASHVRYRTRRMYEELLNSKVGESIELKQCANVIVFKKNV